MNNTSKKEIKVKKRWLKIFIPMGSILAVLVAVILGLHFKNSTSEANIWIPDTDYDLVENSDYIFVGKVNQLSDTKDYDGTGYPMVYYFYDINIIDFLKGEGEEKGTLCFPRGQSSKESAWSEIDTMNTESVEEEKTYLFFANKKSTSSYDKRIGENDYIVRINECKILLKDYDTKKTLEEQDEENKNNVLRYKNIIEKRINYEGKPEIKSCSSLEELTQNYENIALIQVGCGLRSVDGPYPIYSNAIQNTRYLRVCESLKGEKEETLRLVGVNFWPEEISGGVKDLEDSEWYIVFYDTIENCDEVVIFDNQQVIHLEDYTWSQENLQIQNIIDILSNNGQLNPNNRL